MKRGTVILTIISVVILFGFLLLVYTLTNKPTNTDFPQINKIKADDHLKWSPAKKNILVEYGDFQCPACGNFFVFEKQAIEASGSPNINLTKKITFVFRHFPLSQVHPNAFAGAYAAEAASNQGQFWQMHDLLYKNQNLWVGSSTPKDFFAKYAKQLNLNIQQFTKDEDSQAVKDRVNEDMLAGEQAGINSTPTLFLNGKMLSFASYDELLQTLKSL